MAGRSSRVVRAYVMHGRVSGELLDYKAFFDWVGSLPRSSTRIQVGRDLVVAIERALGSDDGWGFRFVSGNPEEVPLLYVEATGGVVPAETAEGTWIAAATRVSVRPEARLVALEVRRGGVGATILERYFASLGRELGYVPKLSMDFNPLPSASFGEELERFTRIREASLVVRRPNNDWDDADDVLSTLADNSSGHRASITVSADRGDSLSPQRGIVGLIKEHLRRPLSNVTDAKVVGLLGYSRQETTLSLDRHPLQERTGLPSNASLSEQDVIIFKAQRELLVRGVEVVDLLSDRDATEST